MFGSTLTLLVRSLKQDSRALFPHLMRLALLGFVVWMLLATHETGLLFGAPGLYFFNQIIWLNFVFISIAGISFFASAITEEKEEMTLGLLMMAGISPVALLLGKSTPRLINAVILLTVQFPFTLLAITLGGVTMHQVLAAYCALLAYMLALGNVALFCSVMRRTSNGASWMTGILLVLFLLSPILIEFPSLLLDWIDLDVIADKIVPVTSSLSHFLAEASIWSRIRSIMLTGFSDPIIGFQVISNLVVAIVFFGLAWGMFRLSVRDDQPAVSEQRWFHRNRRAGRYGAGRAWQSALVWKDFHFLAGGIRMLIVKFMIYGLLLLGLGVYFNVMMGPASFFDMYEFIGGMIITISLIALAAEIAFIAARVFREEVRNQTHAGLMILPLANAEIAYSKVFGCAIGLIPALFYLLIGCMIAPKIFVEILESLDQAPVWWLISMYILFVHLTAFLSLIFKWGAMPLAFGAVVLINGFCMLPFTLNSRSSGEGIAVLFTLASFTGSIVLHIAIGTRLVAKAAQ